MFRHIFLTRLRCSVKDRTGFFWASVFPILLATLFWLALGNIAQGTSFASIPLAVVDSEDYRSSLPLRSALQAASTGDTPLFALRTVSGEEAKRLLRDGRTEGILDARGEDLYLSFRSSGLPESIIKEFADTYLQIYAAQKSMIAQDPLSALRLMRAGYEAVSVKDASGQGSMDPLSGYFFSLIAMACMYGGFQGMTAVMVTQANQSAVAVRGALAPVGRFTLFSASFLAAALLQLVSVLLLYLYISLGIGVQFGSRGWLILLTCALGTLMGVGLGALLSALFKKKEGLMVSLLLAVSMGGSFLAGMMVPQVKYLVQSRFPPAAWLNPVNLITDALYALYLYPTLERFWMNIGMICAMTLIFLTAVTLLMRRPKYASL